MVRYSDSKLFTQVMIILSFLFLNSSCTLFHKKKIIEGTVVNNTRTGTWEGVNIKRYLPVSLVYRNNSITSVNANGYMLQAGDEGPGFKNNHLKNEVITGNQFIWNGNDSTSITHGIFTGYNLNAVIKYNYLRHVPMGIVRKSNGMTNNSGGIAYNIIIDPVVGIVVKGMNEVPVYNNTFYSSKTPSQTWRGLVDIYSNTDRGLNAPSKAVKIFNNIFYTRHQILNIYVYDSACLKGFESDYNIFWCEDGAPLFKIGDSVKTFKEWQALGYDKHSVVMNPGFKDYYTLIPVSRLDYGINLGPGWKTGLSVTARWGTSSPDTAEQDEKWQAGAYILK